MQNPTPPPARFQRFERVSIATRRMGVEFVGKQGTILWRDPYWFGTRTRAVKEWIYSVSLPDLECCRSCAESDLQPTGEFDTEQSQLGSRYEISYDIVMSDDMGVVEGCYRLPGHFWQVYHFGKVAIPELKHSFGTWESGITGVEFEVPLEMRIHHDFVIGAMSRLFEAASWIVVNGPDSMVLR